MSIFAIREIRIRIKGDIDVITNLTSLKMSELAKLKNDLEILQKQAASNLAKDTKTYNQCQSTTALALAQLTTFSSPPVPLPEPLPVAIDINGANYTLLRSHGELNAYVDTHLRPLPMVGGQLADQVRGMWVPKIDEYLSKKAAYDASVTARAQYTTDRTNAIAKLTLAQADELRAQSDMHNNSIKAAQDVADVRKDIKKLARIIEALTNAEVTLRNCLIVGNSSYTAVEIYEQIGKHLNLHLSGSHLLIKLSNSSSKVRVIQEKLSVRMWTRRCLDQFISTAALSLLMLGATYYYDPENFNLSRLMGISVIGLILYKIMQPIREGINQVVGQLDRFNQTIEKFIFRADQFMTNLEDMADLTSDAAIRFMDDMRGKTDHAIKQMDHHLTLARYQIRVVGDDLTTEVKGLPGVIGTTRESLENRLTAVGDRLANTPLANCVIL